MKAKRTGIKGSQGAEQGVLFECSGNMPIKNKKKPPPLTRDGGRCSSGDKLNRQSDAKDLVVDTHTQLEIIWVGCPSAHTPVEVLGGSSGP